ncbi:MAG: putative addiction module antidote protein [Gammaproteobacteria bacterium]|nr:putative addiction module antidote protein [Gammaproteobacteria bacterium]
MRRMGTRKKLKSDEDIACCLNDAYNNDDPATFVVALDDIAKIKGVGYVAKKTGLDRESLYKALSGKTKPQRDTIHSILEKQA